MQSHSDRNSSVPLGQTSGPLHSNIPGFTASLNRASARVLVFSMSGRVRMMTCSFGRCSTHSGLANPTIR